MTGKYQTGNAAAALEVIRITCGIKGYEIPDSAVRQGMEKTRWRDGFMRSEGRYLFLDEGTTRMRRSG